MEALNFLRFWINGYGVHKVNQTQPCNENGGATTAVEVFDHELDEGDDAFIELQFPLHEVEDKGNAGNKELGLSENDNFSKRKIMPIEPISKPQSPIALLKSAQKFRVFSPKKPRPETPKHEKQGGGGGGGKHFTGEDSLRKTNGKLDDSSKSLSKDLVHKYLNAIKPLYTKISKKNSQNDKVGISGDSSLLSPAASPANTRGIYKHLGKSKSSSAAASPINRRDDSLLLQHDGIQSAILHCKRSFNSSRAESSWLSRCTSDSSSHEKLSNASSTDSSLFSRATSSSARTSSEEGNIFT